MSNLSNHEQKVILLMRQLKPYEQIEIKYQDNDPSRLSVTVKSTVKEVFDLGMREEA